MRRIKFCFHSDQLVAETQLCKFFYYVSSNSDTCTKKPGNGYCERVVVTTKRASSVCRKSNLVLVYCTLNLPLAEMFHTLLLFKWIVPGQAIWSCRYCYFLCGSLRICKRKRVEFNQENWRQGSCNSYWKYFLRSE